MRSLAILTVCCLISFAWCFSLDEEETLDGLLEQLEREELVEELEDEIDERMKRNYVLIQDECTVNSRYLKVDIHHKLRISQSKFSGCRKFTLRYQ